MLSYRDLNGYISQNYTDLHGKAVNVIAGLSKVFYDIILLLKVIYCISYICILPANSSYSANGSVVTVVSAHKNGTVLHRGHIYFNSSVHQKRSFMS